MAHPKFVGRMTMEEYFDFEEHTQSKHEYVDGDVFEMNGETRRHNAIVGNIYIRLRTAARGTPCRVSSSGLKLRRNTVVYCPDVMVACGSEPSDERIEVAPCLVVEVLSPSTESIDRREKLLVYKGISSVGAYLIVDQMQKRVDAFMRGAGGVWLAETHMDQGVIKVPCAPLNATLTLDEIYEDVTMPTLEQQLRLREEEAAYF